MVIPCDTSRYARQSALPGFGPLGQGRIEREKTAQFGAEEKSPIGADRVAKRLLDDAVPGDEETERRILSALRAAGVRVLVTGDAIPGIDELCIPDDGHPTAESHAALAAYLARTLAE